MNLSELINFYSSWNHLKGYGYLMISCGIQVNYLRFSDYFWGKRSSLLLLNLPNIRSRIWQRSMIVLPIFSISQKLPLRTPLTHFLNNHGHFLVSEKPPQFLEKYALFTPPWKEIGRKKKFIGGLVCLVRMSIRNKANCLSMRIFKQQDKNLPINLNKLSRP